MLLKAMSPEQLYDSLMTATEADRFEQDPKAKKDLRKSWLNKLTANFGDDEGNEINFNGTVVQALMMMNGDELNNAVKRLAPLYSNRPSFTNKGIMDHVYLATLNRKPTPREESRILQIASSAPVTGKDRNKMSFFQDLFWALLNSNEFILNH
jgi:hypothetical protein